MSGPQNFLNRLQKELKKYDLPKHEIINPHPANLHLLKKNVVKIGRLDGAIYYKITPLNLFNLLKQRRGVELKFIKKLPYSFSMILNKPLNYYLNRSNRKIFRKSDGIVFQSELSKKMHEKFVGVDNNTKLHEIILNGVPTETFYPIKNGIVLEGNPKLVITASFRPHKRLQDAIMIVNSLKKKFKDIKLHVIGDMDNLTKEYISILDTSSCIFHGRVKSEDLPMFYGSCDVGLALGVFDPCPNSVIEMMACGLPVITNSQSGASELLKNKNLIVEDNFLLDFMELQTVEKLPKVDVDMWCKKIEEVLEKREVFSEFVLNRVEEELNIKIVAKKYAAFIQKVYNETIS